MDAKSRRGELLDLLDERLRRALKFEEESLGGVAMPATTAAATSLLQVLRFEQEARLQPPVRETVEELEDRLNKELLGEA